MIRYRGDVKQADAMRHWFALIVNPYGNRILPIDHKVAANWADLRVPHHETALDKLVAATALLHSLLKTRVRNYLGRWQRQYVCSPCWYRLNMNRYRIISFFRNRSIRIIVATIIKQ